MAHEASITPTIIPHYTVAAMNIITAISTAVLSYWAPGGLYGRDEMGSCGN